MNRRVLAAEWLCLWACLFLGVTAMPVLLALFLSGDDPQKVFSAFLAQFYSALFGALFGPSRGYSFFMIALVLSPYLMFQWVRSMFWAVQTLRGKD